MIRTGPSPSSGAFFTGILRSLKAQVSLETVSDLILLVCESRHTSLIASFAPQQEMRDC
jgi:hypothetical protein